MFKSIWCNAFLLRFENWLKFLLLVEKERVFEIDNWDLYNWIIFENDELNEIVENLFDDWDFSNFI